MTQRQKSHELDLQGSKQLPSDRHGDPCQRWGMFTAFRGEAVSLWMVLYSHLHYAFVKANLFSFQSSEFPSIRHNPPLFLVPFIWGNRLCDHKFLGCRKREGRGMSEDSCTGFAWDDVRMSTSQGRGRAGAGQLLFQNLTSVTEPGIIRL